jgi:hypothetical protein
MQCFEGTNVLQTFGKVLPGYPYHLATTIILTASAENISRQTRKEDAALVEWLLNYYVEPFGCIHRRDGLVIQHPDDIGIIQLAHNRYVGLKGPNSIIEQLWVPGLEPTYFWQGEAEVPPMTGPRRLGPWNPAEMQVKYFNPVERKGVLLGPLLDANEWEREIWTLPKREEKESVEPSVERDTPLFDSVETLSTIGPLFDSVETSSTIGPSTPASSSTLGFRSNTPTPVYSWEPLARDRAKGTPDSDDWS